MNTGAYLRKKINPTADFVGGLIAKTHINPNLFSFLAIPVSILGVFLLDRNLVLWATLIYFIASAWDIFDGAVARKQNKTTDFGYYIEGIFDKWVEGILTFGFILIGYEIEGALFLLATNFMTLVKPRAAMVTNIGEFDWPALASRHERLALMVLGLLVWNFYPTMTVGNMVVDTLSFFLIFNSVLVFIGQQQRIFFAKKIIEAGGVENMTNIPVRKR